MDLLERYENSLDRYMDLKREIGVKLDCEELFFLQEICVRNDDGFAYKSLLSIIRKLKDAR